MPEKYTNSAKRVLSLVNRIHSIVNKGASHSPAVIDVWSEALGIDDATEKN